MFASSRTRISNINVTEHHLPFLFLRPYPCEYAYPCEYVPFLIAHARPRTDVIIRFFSNCGGRAGRMRRCDAVCLFLIANATQIQNCPIPMEEECPLLTHSGPFTRATSTLC